MKQLKLLLLIFYLLCANNQLLSSQKITLSMKDASIKDVFKAIEDSSEYNFFYQSDHLSLSNKINIDFTDEEISTILDEVLKNTGLEFIISEKRIIISRFQTKEIDLEVESGIREIHGIITDKSNMPIPGVSIHSKGTTTGTITNVQGKYKIKINSEDEVLIFSFVGLKTQNIPVRGKSTIDLLMYPDVMGLEDVIVIGYGVVKKSDLTGSVTSIKADEINQSPVASLGQALSGRAPGVSIQQTSGRPGTTPSIRIRGGNSINGDNEPLFVIDGFISAKGAQSINPEDIESIEILKDASATAIYGSRGANGVIIISTKRGKNSEKISINYKSSFGTQNVIKRMDMLNAADHIKYLNDNQAYYGLPPRITDPSSIIYDTDWEDAMLQSGSILNHYVSMGGGSEHTRFFGSFDYFNQDGIVINSGYKRYNARMNVDMDLSDHIKAGFKFSYLQTLTNDVSNVFLDALQISPTLPIKTEEGDYNYLLSYDSPGLEIENPIEILKEYTNLQEKKTVGLQAYIEFEILKNLRLRSELSNYWTDKLKSAFKPSDTFAGRQNLSTANISNNQNTAIESVTTLSFDKDLNINHHLNVMVGISSISEKSNGFSAKAKDITDDVLKYYNLGSGDPLQNDLSSDFSELLQISYLGRINYNIREKYLITFSGRYDGSSNFGRNNRFAFFPSSAFAWRLSEEEFIKNLNIFDNLKFRISYGLTGNQAIQPYQIYQLLKPKTTVIGNEPSLYFDPIQLANPNLKWETTRQFNSGLDFGFFNNRLYFNVDYYYKLTNDLLLAKSIPTTTGFSTLLGNIGSIENKGLEIAIKGFILEKDNFGWNSSFSLSLNKNKILDLGESNFIYPNDSQVSNAKTDNTNILKVGEPVGAFYTYVYDGIFQTVEEINSKPSLSGIQPGGMIIKDLDDNGIITENDKKITGNAQPDFIFGFNNEFSIYKNIKINFFWQGAVGGEILNYNNYLYTINQSNIPRSLSDYWTTSNLDAKYPSPGFSGLVTDNYIEDGSYLRLKNISISYNLPKEFLEKIKVNAGSIFLSAYDILTFTRYSGINPEVNFFGSSNTVLNADFNSYPTAKSINVGIRINL